MTTSLSESSANSSGQDSKAAGRNLLDFTDVIAYLTRHGTVSGIQRVITESYKAFMSRDNEACVAVAFSPELREFVVVPVNLLAPVIDALGDGRAPDVVSALDLKIKNSLRHLAPAHPAERDVLVVLGATWSVRGYYNAVARARRLGCGVVNLCYDLIPLEMDSFPRGARELFRTYLEELALLSDRVPCISNSARGAFEQYTSRFGLPTPPGRVTQLPGGMPGSVGRVSEDLVQPFVLCVGSIERRKDQLTALTAWKSVVSNFESQVPKLIFVGRWSWSAHELVDALLEAPEMLEYVEFRDSYVTDAELDSLYRNCLFTIYPSYLEGWGLPVSESLDYGKPVITTTSSSLPEAGDEWALYFSPGDSESLAGIASRLIEDATYRRSLSERIREERIPLSWNDVTDVLLAEANDARLTAHVGTGIAPVMGVEYGLGLLANVDTGYETKRYREALAVRRLPLTGQTSTVPSHARAVLMTECATGHLERGGLRISGAKARTHKVTFFIERPSAGDLDLSFSNIPAWGIRHVEAWVAGRSQAVTNPRTAGPRIHLGKGAVGTPVEVEIGFRLRWWQRTTVVSFVVESTSNSDFWASLETDLKTARSGYVLRSAPVTDADLLRWVRGHLTWRMGGVFRVMHRKIRHVLRADL